jgi:hypothetical protein
MRRITFILLLSLVLPAGAENWMLRWTPLQWTNWVRSTAGTGSVSTAGLQWGSVNLTNWGTISTNILTGLQRGNLNLTNWGTISTNILTNYIRTASITTNTVWTRTYTYTNQVTVPNATFDTNGTITSWVSDGGQYRIDTVRELIVPNLAQFNDYEHQYGIFWTNAANERVFYLLSDNYSAPINTTTAGNTDYMTVKTFLVRAPSGQTVTITNRAWITASDNIAGTNYISMEISKPSTIYGVTPQ